MRLAILFILFTLMNSCKQNSKPEQSIGDLATEYVRLGLAIGQYDSDFVDAYYGPDSLAPKGEKLPNFPKDSFLMQATHLQAIIRNFQDDEDSLTRVRANYLSGQLKAFERRIKIFSGETASFDEEAMDLFGVKPPEYPMAHFDSLLIQLDKLLPGNGTLADRTKVISDRFIIPKEKLDTLFKTAIAEAAKRTKIHYPLPANESFKLEYVTNKPWSGYNWYKGNYQSLIQMNTDLPILIDRIIDVGCHESYPGHHVYNMLLEQHVYREKGWIEISLYPLFSPQSLIAEGSGNYGIEVAFPGKEKVDYAKNVLLPLAGMDTTGIESYFEMIELRGQLNFARNEVARSLLAGKIDEPEAVKQLMKYNLGSEAGAKKSVDFIRKYRTYVMTYNYGLELVANYVESRGGNAGNPDIRWEVFGDLLSRPVTTEELMKK